MNDIKQRLNALVILDEVGSDNPLGRDAVAHIEMLEKALGYISRMTACPDGFINVVTLNTAIQIAKNALAGTPLGPMP